MLGMVSCCPLVPVRIVVPVSAAFDDLGFGHDESSGGKGRSLQVRHDLLGQLNPQ